MNNYIPPYIPRKKKTDWVDVVAQVVGTVVALVALYFIALVFLSV